MKNIVIILFICLPSPITVFSQKADVIVITMGGFGSGRSLPFSFPIPVVQTGELGNAEKAINTESVDAIKSNFPNTVVKGMAYREGLDQYDDILNFIASNSDQNTKIILQGYSFGAWHMNEIAKILGPLGRDVYLLITIDLVPLEPEISFPNLIEWNYDVAPNVKRLYNVRQNNTNYSFGDKGEDAFFYLTGRRPNVGLNTQLLGDKVISDGKTLHSDMINYVHKESIVPKVINEVLAGDLVVKTTSQLIVDKAKVVISNIVGSISKINDAIINFGSVNLPFGNVPSLTIINAPSIPSANNSHAVLSVKAVPILTKDVSYVNPNKPGGVDFSKINFTGFTVDTITGLPDFLSEVTSTVGSDTINIDSVSDQIKRYFLEALILRPENLFVSLDVINGTGRCRLTTPMEKTYIVREMFDHDILMKSDYLATCLFNKGTTMVNKGITADWVNIYKASPFYNNYVQMGFGRLPYLQARAVIIGDSVKINSSGGKLFVKEAPLTLDYELEDLGLDRSGFNFSAAQHADLDRMLNLYRNGIKYRMDTSAVRFINYINTSDRYKKLRDVFFAIASARLYKSLSLPNNPYSDIINTDVFPPAFAHPDTFPRHFYNQMAYQKLHDERFTNLAGQVQLREVWGGVEMMKVEVEDSLALSSSQRQIFNKIDTGYVQNGNQYYLNQGGLGARVPELYAGLFDVTPVDTNAFSISENTPCLVKVTLVNSSFIKAPKFQVAVYDEFNDANNNLQSYKIGEVSVDSVSAYGNKELILNWTPFFPSEHTFRVVIDNLNQVAEIEKANNQRIIYKTVTDNEPYAEFFKPLNGDTLPDKKALLYFIAYDERERVPSTVKITSDRDGLVMMQNDSLGFEVANLSLGRHILTLFCENDRGNDAEDQIEVEVLSAEKPTATIKRPIPNQVAFSQIPLVLEGELFDFVDPLLCDNNTTFWIVAGDTVGRACKINYTFPNTGSYKIIFGAKNNRGFTNKDSIFVTVLNGASSITTIKDFPNNQDSILFDCNNVNGCQRTINLTLPYNARITDSGLSLAGSYVLLEPSNRTSGKDFRTSSIVSSYTGATLNTNRTNYIYNRSTSCLGRNPNSPYSPVNEKPTFRIGETPVIATYLNTVRIAVDVKWEVTRPDGTINSLVTTTPAPPSGQFYPIYPLTININSLLGNNNQGQFKVVISTRPSGSTTFFTEQTIFFTHDYQKSTAPYNSAQPFVASHTMATGVQTATPFHPINAGKQVFQNTESRAYAYTVFDKVADSMFVRWNWYEPSGALYKSETIKVQPRPNTNNWYDWAKVWSYIDIAGTNAAAIPGDWIVTVGVKYFYQSGGLTISSFPTVIRDTFTINGAGNVSYPRDVSVNIGNPSLPVWNYSNEFRTSETISLTSALNQYLQSYQGQDTLLQIPLTITTSQPGRITSDSLWIKYARIDLKPPVIGSNFTLSPSVPMSGQPFSLQCQVTDDKSIQRVNFIFEGTTYQMYRIGSSNTYEIPNVIPGLAANKEFVIEAFDNSGNRSERSSNLMIQNPIANLQPVPVADPITWTNQSSVTVSWPSLGANVAQYFVQLGQLTAESIGTNTQTILSPLIEGSYSVKVFGKDGVGNQTLVGTTNIYLDRTAPEKVMINQLPTEIINWKTDTSFLIKWLAANDIGSGVNGYQICIDDVIQTGIIDTLFFKYKTTETGIHKFQVRAVDRTGLVGPWSDTIAIKVDLLAPLKSEIISSTHPDTSKWYNNRQPKFDLIGFDQHSGLFGHRYLFTSSPLSEPNSTSFITEEDTLSVSSLPVFDETQSVTEGIWYLHLRPFDVAGNYGQISRTRINIDISPPNTINDLPQDTVSAPYVVNFSASDQLSGVKETHYRIGKTGPWYTGNQVILDTFGTIWLHYFSEDNAGNIASPDSVRITVLPDSISFAAKIFLQGAYVTNSLLLKDNLRNLGIIPLTEPYSQLGFTSVKRYSKNISPIILTRTGEDAIVDWVLIELRHKSDPKIIVQRRPALLQRDGDIVNTDGVSKLSFSGVPLDSYYVAVHHRNHFGVMTANKINFSSNLISHTLDFTSPLFEVHGTAAQKEISGRQYLWTGDINRDGRIKYNGSGNDRNAILSIVGLTTPNKIVSGYLSADVNMDGQVKYNGSSNDRNAILSVIGLTVPNNTLLEQVPKQ